MLLIETRSERWRDRSAEAIVIRSIGVRDPRARDFDLNAIAIPDAIGIASSIGVTSERDRIAIVIWTRDRAVRSALVGHRHATDFFDCRDAF
jgi:hypothetical protein